MNLLIAVSQAAELVRREREHQIALGYTAAHDDAHGWKALDAASFCYAVYSDARVPPEWPWEAESWKPQTTMANKLRSCALALAAYEAACRARNMEELVCQHNFLVRLQALALAIKAASP